MKQSLYIFISIIIISTATSAMAASVSVVTKETLKGWMEKEGATILDARQGRDWTSSEFKIKGALRTDHSKLGTWISKLSKNDRIVIYCA